MESLWRDDDNPNDRVLRGVRDAISSTRELTNPLVTYKEVLDNSSESKEILTQKLMKRK